MATARGNPFRADLFTGWREGEEPRLLGSRCTGCGQAFFPPRAFCATCPKGGTVVPAQLGPVGTLYAWTMVHVAPRRFRPPYPIGFVDLPEGVRVCAQLTGFSEQGPFPAPGSEVEMVVEPISEDPQGNPLLGYKFRPRSGNGRARGAER